MVRKKKTPVDQITDRLRAVARREIREATSIAMEVIEAEIGCIVAETLGVYEIEEEEKPKKVPTAGKICGRVGCNKPVRSKGYCASDYQNARNNGWEMPCPENYDPPLKRRKRKNPEPPPEPEVKLTEADIPMDHPPIIPHDNTVFGGSDFDNSTSYGT